MSAGYIEYGIDIPYTITALNAVGPTTDTTIRPNSALPWPDARSTGAPDYDTINKDNDANVIYLDPENGNDGDTGFTLPLGKLTLAGAEAAVTATRHTIHIEGTSTSATTLNETLSGSTNLDANLRNIQVASGQICILTINSGNYALAAANNFTVHGLEIVNTSDDQRIFAFAGAVTHNYEWCRFDSKGASAESSATQPFNISDTVIIIRGTSSSSSISQMNFSTQTLTVSNSIFAGTGIINNALAIGDAVATVTIDLTHCTFVGVSTPVQAGASLTTLTTTNNHSHIVHRCATVFKNLSSTSLSSIITNSLINAGVDGIADTTSTTNVKKQNPLFLDQADFDFRLAHIGRTVEGVNYPVSSPAIGLGLSDAGAWDHTYVAGAETLSTFTFADELGLESLKLIGERTNYQKFQDIQGRFFNTHDGVTYRVEITLANKYWTGNPWSYELLEICRQTGVMRFYPNDYLTTTASVVTLNDETEIDLTGLTRNLSVNQVKKWVAKISWTNIGSLIGWYEIGINAATRLSELVHVRGDIGFSLVGATDHSVTIDYLPVLLDMSSVELISEYYSDDTTNDTFKPWHPDQTADHVSEFHIRKFILRQTEVI